MRPRPDPDKRGTAEGFNHETLLTPAEVAALFRVTPKQVTRWAIAGKLQSVRTIGNHRRFFRAEVETFLHGGAS